MDCIHRNFLLIARVQAHSHTYITGMKPAVYTSTLSQLCETLPTSWTLDLTLIQAERLPKTMQPFVELSICDARTGDQVLPNYLSLSLFPVASIGKYIPAHTHTNTHTRTHTHTDLFLSLALYLSRARSRSLSLLQYVHI